MGVSAVREPEGDEDMKRSIVTGAVLCALCAVPLRADILSVSPGMTILVPPVSVEDEGFTESSTTMFIIDEGVSMVPPGPPDLFVNAFGPGMHGGSFPPSLMMPSGTLFHSYLVHFDPAGGIVSLTGSVTFDPGELIFGIQTYTPLLYTTDGPFGNPLVTYPAAFISTRGFDTLPAPADMVTIAGDLNTATFSLTAELGVDQARIFTIPVPQPASVVLLLAGAGFGLIRRTRR
jgi:hypothetical protein